MSLPLPNLIGQTFGLLTVVKGPLKEWKGGAWRAVWDCQCACGNRWYVSHTNLGRSTTSCGCQSSRRSIHKQGKKRKAVTT